MGIISKVVGKTNVLYLKSLFPSKEERLSKSKRKKFYSQFMKEGDIFFDVGANMGNRISPLIGMGIEIIAVEPQIECASYLRRRFGNKIKVVTQGLGASIGKATMHISNSHTISTFSKEFITETSLTNRFEGALWQDTRTIEMTTLDRLIDQYGVPKFIKIDVEGYEYEVLSGLSTAVPLLSFEYTVPEQSTNIIKCIKRIQKICDQETLCNFSIGESMKWELKEWSNIGSFLKIVESKKFVDSSFGDIYVASKEMIKNTAPSVEH